MRPHIRTGWIYCSALLATVLTAAALEAQGRHPLRHTIAVGDRSIIEAISDTTLRLEASADGQAAPPIEATTRFREKYVEEVLALSGKAPAALRHQYLVARTSTPDPMGNPVVETSSLQGKTFTIKRQGGKVMISPPGAKLTADDRKRLMRTLEQIRIPFLPDREASINDEWPIDPDQAKLFFPQARTAALKARFEEVKPHAGYECARIRVTGDLDLTVEGIPGPVKAQITGDVYHALSIQRPVAIEFTAPLAVSTRTQQNGRSISITGEGTLTAKVLIEWQKVAGKTVATPARRTAPSERTPDDRAMSRTVAYGEITFQLPGPGWKALRYDQEARRIEVGLPEQGQMRGISVWPEDVPQAERHRSPKELVARYFDSERQAERPDGPWTGFKEGEREIGKQRYPTMTFQFHPNVSNEHVMDGMFLVVFPEDFEKRGRFFVLMWADLHPKNVPARGLEELDTVVSSFRLAPLKE
jgi:hypothetical protein